MLEFLESPFMTPVSLLVVLCGLLYWYCVNTFDYWKKKRVPYIKPLPFFGNTKETILMKKTSAEVHQDLYHQFEGHKFAGFYTSKTPTLMLRDPEIIKSVLVKDFQHFHDRDAVIDFKRNPLQQNLFVLQGHKWRVLRNKMSPTFTSGKMKNMFMLMEQCCENLNKYLQGPAKDREIVEMKDILSKFTTDVVGNCVFGIQMNALENPDSEFRRMGRKIFEPSAERGIRTFLNIFLPQVANFFKVGFLQKDINDFFINVVKETGQYRLKHNIIRNDFMQLLMQLRYKGKVDEGEEKEESMQENGVGGKTQDGIDFDIDDNLMAAQAFVFFIAGFETSSSTMSFAIYELAKHPEVQTKLRKEIDIALQENGGKFTYESIMNMKYLDQVISETLRLYPPVQFLRRGVTSPYTLPGTDVVLDKGLSVVVPIYAMQRDPKYFPDPDRFDPERFTEEERVKRPHYVYLPFGEGPRNCIGMRFGLMQSKLGLATLISKYEFHVCERTQIPIKLHPRSPVLSSTDGTTVRITNRS